MSVCIYESVNLDSGDESETYPRFFFTDLL